MKNKIIFIIIFIISILSYTSYQLFSTKNKKKSLSILSWYNSFDEKTLKEFEKKTGITVNIKYYTSNEELVSKLSISNEGIDIIFPTDYIFSELINLKLVKEIDLKRIDCYSKIFKELFYPVIFKNKYYGIPREWGVYGLVIQKEIKKLIPSNNLIYKSFFEGHYKNTILKLASDNDIPTTVNFVYFYYKNFFKNNKIYYKENLFTIIYEILKKQKKYMILYGDSLLENLFLDNIIDMAILQSDRYIKMIENNDNINIDFILSSYANLKVIEYAAISSNSQSIDAAYEFINFILEEKLLLENALECCFFPSRKDLISKLSEPSKILLNEIEKQEKTLVKTENILNKKDSAALWMKLKS